MKDQLSVMNKNILSIETTTNICSVSLFNHTELIAIKEDSNRNHSSLLGKFVNDIFQNSDMDINCVDAIALSIGPGSYTGLRIGLSFAKGMAFSLNKPIIPIDTIESLNYSIQNKDINYFVVAEDIKGAKNKARKNSMFIKKRMHIDGIQKLNEMDGYRIILIEDDLGDDMVIYRDDDVKYNIEEICDSWQAPING